LLVLDDNLPAYVGTANLMRIPAPHWEALRFKVDGSVKGWRIIDTEVSSDPTEGSRTDHDEDKLEIPRVLLFVIMSRPGSCVGAPASAAGVAHQSPPFDPLPPRLATDKLQDRGVNAASPSC